MNYDESTQHKLVPERVNPILDLSKADTEAAARNSVLMEPEVVTKLISMARSGEDGTIGTLSKLGVRSLQASIMRGFNNMFKTLKYDYVKMLVDNNLLENLISYMVLIAGASSFAHNQQMRDYLQQDMQLNMRKERWTQGKRGEAINSIEMIQNDDKTKVLIKMKVYDYDMKTQKV